MDEQVLRIQEKKAAMEEMMFHSIRMYRLLAKIFLYIAIVLK